MDLRYSIGSIGTTRKLVIIRYSIIITVYWILRAKSLILGFLIAITGRMKGSIRILMGKKVTVIPPIY